MCSTQQANGEAITQITLPGKCSELKKREIRTNPNNFYLFSAELKDLKDLYMKLTGL